MAKDKIQEEKDRKDKEYKDMLAIQERNRKLEEEKRLRQKDSNHNTL